LCGRVVGRRYREGGSFLRSLVVAITLSLACWRSDAETIRYEAIAIGAHGVRSRLSSGTREYSVAKDIEVLAPSAPKRGPWKKRLHLFGSYDLQASVYRLATLDGFGLRVDDEHNQRGFSWEWFDRDWLDRSHDDIFVKRQGHGRVVASVRRGTGYVELTAVEFLDDVVLRYADDAARFAKDARPTIEIKIEKGSIFRVAP
jgi:hypothetical protein